MQTTVEQHLLYKAITSVIHAYFRRTYRYYNHCLHLVNMNKVTNDLVVGKCILRMNFTIRTTVKNGDISSSLRFIRHFQI